MLGGTSVTGSILQLTVILQWHTIPENLRKVGKCVGTEGNIEFAFIGVECFTLRKKFYFSLYITMILVFANIYYLRTRTRALLIMYYTLARVYVCMQHMITVLVISLENIYITFYNVAFR